MNDNAKPYIVAISGGVDSCVLLDMLVNNDNAIKNQLPGSAKFIVAHVNHGIRTDTADRDQDFVAKLSEKYSLDFETTNLHLGPNASEEAARNGRYSFLESLVKKYKANGILLAHHLDDSIETAVINHIRGTGRRGMTSLSSTNERIRPLLHMTKEEVYLYAKSKDLHWVEDETNIDLKYLRNRVRANVGQEQKRELRSKFATQLQDLKKKNDLADKEIANLLQYKMKGKSVISRNWFVKLPHDFACELMHAALQAICIQNIDKQLVERLTIALKVASPGAKLDIDKNTIALITKRSLRFVSRDTLKTL